GLLATPGRDFARAHSRQRAMPHLIGLRSLAHHVTSARGYEPSTFSEVQALPTSASAAATEASRSCPSTSMKKTYSHGRRRDGRLSLLARLIERFAHGSPPP